MWMKNNFLWKTQRLKQTLCTAQGKEATSFYRKRSPKSHPRILTHWPVSFDCDDGVKLLQRGPWNSVHRAAFRGRTPMIPQCGTCGNDWQLRWSCCLLRRRLEGGGIDWGKGMRISSRFSFSPLLEGNNNEQCAKSLWELNEMGQRQAVTQFISHERQELGGGLLSGNGVKGDNLAFWAKLIAASHRTSSSQKIYSKIIQILTHHSPH